VLKECNERPDFEIREKLHLAQKIELDSHESNNDSGCDRVLPLDEEVIKRHRLSLEEIHAILRFQDYEPGLPNEVLVLTINILHFFHCIRNCNHMLP
jgi:hypothetical protein